MVGRIVRMGVAVAVGVASAVVAVAGPAAADVECTLPTGASTGGDRFAVWGDSLAYGRGAGAYNWSAILAQRSGGTERFNGGSPGERVAGIAARQGGRPARLQSDVTLPADGDRSGVLDFNNSAVFRHVEDSAFSVTGVFTDTSGSQTVTYHGAIEWLAVPGVDGANRPQVFRPDLVPDPPVTLHDGSKFRADMGVEHRGWDQIFWAGHNDFNAAALEDTIPDIVPSICDMVEYNRVDNFLVLGLSNGGPRTGEDPDYPDPNPEPDPDPEPDPTSFYYRAIYAPGAAQSINERLAAVFGAHYLDIRQELINQFLTIDPEDLDDHDATCAADQDTNDVTNSMVPCTLRAFGPGEDTSAERSTGHLNPLGNCLVARAVSIKTAALDLDTGMGDDDWFDGSGHIQPNVTLTYCLNLPVT